jgi:hypothetical protein
MHRKFIRNEKGQAMAEFAFAIPVVILVIFGIYEFGRLFYVTTLMNETAQEAVRLATLPQGARDTASGLPFDATFIRNRIVNLADSLDLFVDGTDRTNAYLSLPASALCGGVIVNGTRSYSAADGFPSLMSSLNIAIYGEDGITNRNGSSCVLITYRVVGFPLTNTLMGAVGLPPVTINASATMENQYED